MKLQQKEPFLAGSAIIGKRFGGTDFDEGYLSDWDVIIVSKTLIERAKHLGIPLRSKGTRTRPLISKDLEKLDLKDLVEQLSKKINRPISFIIYQSKEAASVSGPIMPIPT